MQEPPEWYDRKKGFRPEFDRGALYNREWPKNGHDEATARLMNRLMLWTAIICTLLGIAFGVRDALASCEQLLGTGYRCKTPMGESVTVTPTLGGAHRYDYQNGGFAIERPNFNGGYSYSTTGRTGDLPMEGGTVFRPYD
ncbi:MAG TPA: hypothetical protein P5558_16705 [Geminicoccaceae bacterium]|nr:hypothetical protein [Geminicoccaceae bacterium]